MRASIERALELSREGTTRPNPLERAPDISSGAKSDQASYVKLGLLERCSGGACGYQSVTRETTLEPCRWVLDFWSMAQASVRFPGTIESSSIPQKPIASIVLVRRVTANRRIRLGSAQSVIDLAMAIATACAQGDCRLHFL
jgi:hypothetical protein